MAQGERMKGYIISFSAILLLSSMLVFSMFYSENVQSRGLELNKTKKYSKLEFIKDDLGFDANKILGTSIKVERTENLEMTFNEIIPADFNKMQRIVKWKEFIESSYSSANNSAIGLNINRLNKVIPVKFSNGLRYDYNFDDGKNSVLFYSETGNTKITAMDLNLTVQGSSVDVSKVISPMDFDVTVNFNYVDQNALNETHESFQITSTAENIITIRFSDDLRDVIEIRIGTFNGKNNAVWVWNRSFNQNKINLSFKPVMTGIDVNSSFRGFLDVDLNYFQTDLNSNSLIELKQFS
jgi:hypothetical protein